MSQLLTETLFSIRDPWIIAEQKRILVEEDDSQFSKFVFQNYGIDYVCTSLVENYCIRFPAKIPTVLSIIGKRRLLEYDTSGDGDKLDKKGGFWKKTGNWFKRVVRGVGDAMYDAKRGILGDKEADEAEKAYDELMAKYEQAADKSVKKLFDSIKADYPSFPNIDKDDDVRHAIKVNKLPADTSAQGVFIHALSKVAIMYDTLVAAVEKGPDNGGITADMANEVIKDLRAALNFHSKKLSAVYKKFETDEPEGKVLDEDDQIDERAGGGQYHGSGGESDDAGDGKKGSSLDIKAGEDTDATKQNKSQTIEKALIALGLSAAAIGFLIKMGVLKMLVKWLFSSTTPDTIQEVPQTVLEKVEELQKLGLTYGLKGIDSHSTAKEIIAAGIKEGWWDKAGNLVSNGGLETAWEKGGQNLASSAAELKATLFDPSNLNKPAEAFWGVAKYKNHSKLALVTVKSIKFVGSTVIKKVLVKGGTTITATGLAILAAGTAAAPWLIGLGLGAAVVGGTSLWLKKKGLKTSRAAAIQELINRLQDVSGPSPKQPDVPTETPEEASPSAGGAPSPKEVDSVLKDKELFDLIKKLIKDNEDLKKQIEELRKNPSEIKNIDPHEKGPEGAAASIVATVAAAKQPGAEPDKASIEAGIEAAINASEASSESEKPTSGKEKISLKALINDIPEEKKKKDPNNSPNDETIAKILKKFKDNVPGVAITQDVRKEMGDDLRIRLDKAIRNIIRDQVVEVKSDRDDLLIENWGRLAGLNR